MELLYGSCLAEVGEGGMSRQVSAKFDGTANNWGCSAAYGSAVTLPQKQSSRALTTSTAPSSITTGDVTIVIKTQEGVRVGGSLIRV